MPVVHIISTADGSHSLLNTELNETYHSVHGAIQESQHVFIRNGLEHWLAKSGRKKIRIFELGFGTGLNVLLSLLSAQKSGLQVYYESWETSPLHASIIGDINYGDKLGAVDDFKTIHSASWGNPASLEPGFTLFKRKADLLTDVITETKFDLIYYDAFAPSKQPEMWTMEILKKVTDAMTQGADLVTYCAKGQVKRDLAALGLTVETLPGPPGKKEMIRACTPKRLA